MTHERQLHLNVNVLRSGSHQGSWRASDGRPIGYIDPQFFADVARVAERGLLDAVFFADGLAIGANAETAPGYCLDPITVVAHMAASTSRIGFIATCSTTFTHPYTVARAFASLDHLTRGRIGLNLVTTMYEGVAQNFGLKDLPEPEDRYARAFEFAEVVTALWDSWEDAALIADRSTGRFADATKIHPIGHRGRFFDVVGPLQVPRSPQGRPLLVQAGGSELGRELAARHADAVFSVAQLLGEAQAYYADLKERTKRAGRDPDSIAILPGLSPIIGSTESEAKARKRELDELAGIEDDEAARDQLAARLGVEPGDLRLDEPVPEIVLAKAEGWHRSVGFAQATLSLLRDRSLTVRDIVQMGGGHRRVVGTPEQVADAIEHWFVEGAADGFNIMSDVYPSGLETFVDHVVPVLQKRGLFRREYESTTLRGHYGLSRPENIFEHRGVLDLSL
ncbi:LLM class flavin-dependent oxidoreductase [Methylosinus sp. H3A]|uniref:LLM class flavin-dependent oxidoreductase n=1 Tax=Methylosinus sp. H3A TaxID=2785786 RepID=UPI0018C2517A|nr:LLM class flavin-dependent oxidoreductase [Methylosinus sp. H3A]MBG0808272.1 LLM class flavin-dependent oxidoreductase [Methylosinus sp. H3A]